MRPITEQLVLRTVTATPQPTITNTPQPTATNTPQATATPEPDPPTIRITYRLGGRIMALRVVTDETDIFLYPHLDHLGSIVGMSWKSGSFVDGSLARFYPFGKYRTEPAVDLVAGGRSDRGFTGHRHNEDLGLIYMNARFYLPEVGRFASPDTIVPDPSNPQSFNRYSYVHNNPINNTDPTGHCINAATGNVTMSEAPYGTSGLCSSTQYDMTAWLAAEMVSNANGPEMADMQAVLNQPQPLNLSGLSGIAIDTQYLQMLINFYKLNKTNGLWDFKQNMLALGGGVVLCGNDGCFWVDYSTPGNIHFGYVAAAVAVPEQLSMAAGGYLEIRSSSGSPGNLSTLFENPYDWAAVSLGYDLYNSFGGDMTLTEFQGALTTDVGQSLQPPPSDFRIPGPAHPQENNYPLGYFDVR